MKKVKALIDFAAAFFKGPADNSLQSGGITMYLLPKTKRVVRGQGFYEIRWNTMITIDEKMQENGSVYAAILQECIRKYAGIE